MNIDEKYHDDELIFKLGMTKSLEQRKNGHKSEYKELEVNMICVCMVFIDPFHQSKAEKELKTLLSRFSISYKNHDELIILPKNELQHVKQNYELIGFKYAGYNKDLNDRIFQIEQLNVHERHEYEKQIASKNLECEKIVAKCELYVMRMKRYYENTILANNNNNDKKIFEIKEECNKKISSVQEECNKKISTVTEECNKKISSVQEECDRKISTVQEECDQKISFVQEDCDQKISFVQEDCDQKISVIKKKLSSERKNNVVLNGRINTLEKDNAVLSKEIEIKDLIIKNKIL